MVGPRYLITSQGVSSFLVSLSSFILARDPDDGRPQRPPPGWAQRWRTRGAVECPDELLYGGSGGRGGATSDPGSSTSRISAVGGHDSAPRWVPRARSRRPRGYGGEPPGLATPGGGVLARREAGALFLVFFFRFFFFLDSFSKTFSLLFSTNLFLQNFLLNFFHNFCSDFFFFPKIFINFCGSFFFRKLVSFFIQNFCITFLFKFVRFLLQSFVLSFFTKFCFEFCTNFSSEFCYKFSLYFSLKFYSKYLS
jgi:hypothetical protein